MMDKDLDFEEFFEKRLEEDKDDIKNLPYSLEELREIYQQEYDYLKNMPPIELKTEPQDINFKIAEYYLPEKWEIRNGKLLYSDEELLNVLKLIIFNLGVKKSLDSIPFSLIEKFIREKKL